MMVLHNESVNDFQVAVDGFDVFAIFVWNFN